MIDDCTDHWEAGENPVACQSTDVLVRRRGKWENKANSVRRVPVRAYRESGYARRGECAKQSQFVTRDRRGDVLQGLTAVRRMDR